MIELVRQPARLGFTVFVWGEVLKLGRLYGWKPAGTLPPEEADAEERAAWDAKSGTCSAMKRPVMRPRPSPASRARARPAR